MCHYEILDLGGGWEPKSVSGFLLHETGDGEVGNGTSSPQSRASDSFPLALFHISRSC